MSRRSFGYITTSATTEAFVSQSTYTEQASGAGRSLKSSSASDTAAGSGARTVEVLYYTLAADGTITGPLKETVTLNGTTAVPTVATNIALIESLKVLTAGSGGVAAGTITIYDDNAGAGSAITTIQTGDLRSFMAHHYVPTGRRCTLTDIVMTSGAAVGQMPIFKLKTLTYGVTGAAENQISGALAAKGLNGSNQVIHSGPPVIITGPARVRAYVTPSDSGSQISRIEIGYLDSPNS